MVVCAFICYCYLFNTVDRAKQNNKSYRYLFRNNQKFSKVTEIRISHKFKLEFATFFCFCLISQQWVDFYTSTASKFVAIALILFRNEKLPQVTITPADFYCHEPAFFSVTISFLKHFYSKTFIKIKQLWTLRANSSQ